MSLRGARISMERIIKYIHLLNSSNDPVTKLSALSLHARTSLDYNSCGNSSGGSCISRPGKQRQNIRSPLQLISTTSPTLQTPPAEAVVLVIAPYPAAAIQQHVRWIRQTCVAIRSSGCSERFPFATFRIVSAFCRRRTLGQLYVLLRIRRHTRRKCNSDSENDVQYLAPENFLCNGPLSPGSIGARQSTNKFISRKRELRSLQAGSRTIQLRAMLFLRFFYRHHWKSSQFMMFPWEVTPSLHLGQRSVHSCRSFHIFLVCLPGWNATTGYDLARWPWHRQRLQPG